MANSASYMKGRKSFLRGAGRPQALLFSNNPGTIETVTESIANPITGQSQNVQRSYRIPTGTEGIDFIILSDHNRSEINISQDRIETRQRMINGGMRSYWIADKLKISTSWQRLPSRPFSLDISFNSSGNVNKPTYDEQVAAATKYESYTVDGAAGGTDLLSWYENHPGSFYLFLSYDKYRENGIENYNKLYTYNQVIKVYFASFDYSVEKRSGSNFDFWNVNLSLEEA